MSLGTSASNRRTRIATVKSCALPGLKGPEAAPLKQVSTHLRFLHMLVCRRWCGCAWVCAAVPGPLSPFSSVFGSRIEGPAFLFRPLSDPSCEEVKVSLGPVKSQSPLNISRVERRFQSRCHGGKRVGLANSLALGFPCSRCSSW